MIKSKEEFFGYAKKKLGHPIVSIQVTYDQFEIILKDCLTTFQEFHIDGTQRDFLPIQITEEDLYNRYLKVDSEYVHSIVDIVHLNSLGINQTEPLFDPMYQFFQQMQSLGSGFDATSYYMFRSHSQMLNHLLVPKRDWNYNRYTNQLKIFCKWEGSRYFGKSYLSLEDDKMFLLETDSSYDTIYDQLMIEDKAPMMKGNLSWNPNQINLNSFIVIEYYKKLNVEENPELLNDHWFKEFYCAHLKKQWGVNLTKFNSINLPGGVQLNGEQILSSAENEIDKLREELERTYQEPMGFFLG